MRKGTGTNLTNIRRGQLSVGCLIEERYRYRYQPNTRRGQAQAPSRMHLALVAARPRPHRRDCRWSKQGCVYVFGTTVPYIQISAFAVPNLRPCVLESGGDGTKPRGSKGVGKLAEPLNIQLYPVTLVPVHVPLVFWLVGIPTGKP